MADVVRGQIAYSDPEGPMKPNLVTGEDAASVSLYIAKCAGNPNCGVTAATNAPPPAGGGGTTPAAPDGKQIFTSAGCGGCHTLKDANAKGNVGPNLDQKKPSEQRVAHQVEVGGGAMPPFKGRLTPAQIKAVAAYVSKVANRP